MFDNISGEHNRKGFGFSSVRHWTLKYFADEREKSLL